MKKLFDTVRDSHDLIFKGLLTVACIGLLVFIFPKVAKFKFEFDKSTPWKHENLLAPFEFPIYKSETELQEERNAIRETLPPYFRIHYTVLADQQAKYINVFEAKWPESELAQQKGLIKRMFDSNSPEADLLKEQHFQAGKAIIQHIYNQGIIQISETIDGKPGDYEIILMDEQNISENKALNAVYTLQTAYDYSQEQLQKTPDLDVDVMTRILDKVMVQNIFFDPETTERVLQEKLDQNSITRGLVSKGEKIIDRGDIVNDERYQKLVSLKLEYEKQAGGTSTYYIILAGQFILITVSVFVLILFLTLFRKDIVNENNRMAFIMVVFTLAVLMANITPRFEWLNIYALPFCLLPIIIRTFYDVRLATFIHVIATVLIGFLAPNGFEFVFLQLITGFVAVFSLVSLRKRSQLLGTAFIIFLTYSIIYLGIAIIQEGNFHSINLKNFAWFAASAGLTLFAFPIIFLFEKAFGFLSDVSLMELSDTNSPLLRKLASKTPGTFQHTLQVANLAEEAVLQIGGDPLLVRTGALYHDIGKMNDPVFFIENQISGVNPHDELSYEESARIIISHVIEGIEMAKKAKLPEHIIDFIRTHHGTTMTMYFYNSYKNDHPGEEIDASLFQYPGPVPFSKETAVLMMADSVEAASRSLKKHDAENISNLVENIIDGQAKQNQFVNADITFKDISTIKKIFKKMLMNIYHVRIEYPE